MCIPSIACCIVIGGSGFPSYSLPFVASSYAVVFAMDFCSSVVLAFALPIASSTAWAATPTWKMDLSLG